MIRRLNKADLPELALLYQQLLPNSSSLARMEAVFDELEGRQSHLLLVAEKDGRLVGTVLACVCQMYFGLCRSFMIVEDLVVDEAHRGQGIGRQLMQQAEAHAKANDCSYIMLVTDRDRTSSRQFYQSIGYRSDAYCAFKKHL